MFGPLRLVILIAGLLLPGALVLRAFGLPRSLAGSFAVSCTLLYVTAVACSITGAPVTPFVLAIPLAAIGVLAAATGRRGGPAGSRLDRTGPIPPARPDSRAAIPRGTPAAGGALWTMCFLVYFAFLVIAAYLLVTNPLSGPDTGFRWSRLAEQMTRLRTLDFYPPRSAGDFLHYFWPESIPPGIASTYAWAYACAGSTNPLWTSPVVALQTLSLHELIWRLARARGGPASGALAVALAVSCPILNWSFLMGQETGLLAVGVCGMIWCFERTGGGSPWGWATLAAAFATCAACTREYACAFVAVAVLAAWGGFRSRGDAARFAALALPLASAWPLETWIRTGNPVYSLNLAGLFTVNPVFATYSDETLTRYFTSNPVEWHALAGNLLLWAFPSVAAIAAWPFVARRIPAPEFGSPSDAPPPPPPDPAPSRGGPPGPSPSPPQPPRAAPLRNQALRLFALAGAALWLLSVPHTLGGPFYSLRVLSPVFAVAAVVSGAALASALRRPRVAAILCGLLGLLAADGLLKTLVLPMNIYRTPPGQWASAASHALDTFRARDATLLAQIKALPGEPRWIASDYLNLPAILDGTPVKAVPLWSPQVAWLFDPSLDSRQVAGRWRESGLSYIAINNSGATLEFLEWHAHLESDEYRLQVVSRIPGYVILEFAPRR
ncbi:MAG TPA: hypothetical protein VN775_05065 [Opitutaceae bacterium]|nr:hypothetical protein [Opitutaceae bacterium]